MSQNNLSHIHRIAKSIGIPLECEINEVWRAESLVIAARKTKFRISPTCEHLIPLLKEFFLNTTEPLVINDFSYFIPKGSFKEGVYFSFYGHLHYCDGTKLYPYSYEHKGFNVNGNIITTPVENLTFVYGMDAREIEELQYS